MNERNLEIERFEQAVQRIRGEFPSLRVDVTRDHPHVEAMAELPKQTGLDFEVSINLQNQDELHLNAGDHFWVEWFPCGDDEVFERFLQAAVGVISGEFRIVESFVLGRAVRAELQQPVAGGKWKRFATWGNLGCLVPWVRSRRVVRNQSAASLRAV